LASATVIPFGKKTGPFTNVSGLYGWLKLLAGGMNPGSWGRVGELWMTMPW
jgi:hypothetical protein